MQLAREGLLLPETVRGCRWVWCNSRTGEATAAILYAVDMNDGHVTLKYPLAKRSDYLQYDVELVSTMPHYGGRRWWFRCPAPVAGGICGRRVRKP